MARESTSKEMASLAAKLMHHPEPDVRRLAACVLTQREPLLAKIARAVGIGARA